MSVADARRDSPCIDICRIDPASGWCEGCRRSLDEIAAWGLLDAAGRRRILDELPRRRTSATAVTGCVTTDPTRRGEP